MFHVENNVPDVYIQESRDFQLLARLYDLVLQSSRYNIESMRTATSTYRCVNRLLTAISSKVGFFDQIDITDYADRLLLHTFPYIIQYKGSMQGIDMVCALFERITGTHIEVTFDKTEQELKVKFTDRSSHIELFDRLMKYVLPCGVSVVYETFRQQKLPDTIIPVSDELEISDRYNTDGVIYNSEGQPYSQHSTLGTSIVSTNQVSEEIT